MTVHFRHIDSPIGLLFIAADDTGSPAFTATKTVTRSFFDADGNELPVDTRDVTVTADKTTELRGRERVEVSWTGARPSAGRASNPFGEQGLNQEYPVVILQCRGLDDPSLDPGQQLSPSTCWTSTWSQRSQSLPSSSRAFFQRGQLIVRR